MTAPVFVDTNIWFYALSAGDEAKRLAANTNDFRGKWNGGCNAQQRAFRKIPGVAVEDWSVPQ